MSGGRTKLVCTIGPASVDRLDELVAAGMDVARINFSHGTPNEHADAVARVREASSEAAVMVDLPGPKIRLGGLSGDAVALSAGDGFVLRPGDEATGDARGAGVTYAALAADLRPGDRHPTDEP